MALYHIYRPTNFGEIIGQEHITTTLQNALKRNWITHAYLFMGPRGTGKTTAARVFAKAANCSGEDRPCNVCESCQIFNRGSLDLIEIDAASNTGVDMIREAVRDSVHFAPSEADYKVYVIDEAHMLSKQANNALLKTLEEPPDHVIFILVTTEPERIISTVISRCQQHQFRLVPVPAIVDLLEYISAKEGFVYEGGALQLIARQAHGCVRDSVMLLDQMSVYDQITEQQIRDVLGLGEDRYVYELVDKLSSGQTGKALDVIHNVLNDGIALGQFVDQTVGFLHDALRYKMGSLGASELNDGRLRFCKQVGMGVQDVVGAIENLVDAKSSMQLMLPEIALSMGIASIAPPQSAAQKVLFTAPEPSIEVVQPEPKKEDPLKDPLVQEFIKMGAEVVGVWG